MADESTTTQTRELMTFEEWKRRYAQDDSGEDYDLRGAFDAGVTPDANGHWPDTFKRPTHPTFSNESIFAFGVNESQAGHWENGRFIPSDAARCRLCGSILVKTTDAHTAWQQFVCPKIDRGNKLGHSVLPVGYLRPIETVGETGRETNRETALNIILRSNGWLRSKLEDEPNCQCGCGSCVVCAYRYFEKATVAPSDTEQVRLREALESYVKFSDEAAKLLDADNDVKCLKLLLAMSGHAPRYRHDVDEARAAIQPKDTREHDV